MSVSPPVRSSGLARFAMLLAAALMLAGCETMQQFAPPPPPTLADARAAYQQGDFEAAYKAGSSVSRRTDSIESYEGSYIAGLSAEQLGDRPNAVRYLRMAASGPDHRIAGDAGAQLGLVYAELARHQESADALLDAARKLRGEDQAKAYFYAAISEQKLGQWAQARTHLILARARTKDATLEKQIGEQLKVTGYTIQVGAYTSEENASNSAKGLAPLAIDLRLGAPKLVTATDTYGRQLILVQVGEFASYASARQSRGKLGYPQAIIVPLAGE